MSVHPLPCVGIIWDWTSSAAPVIPAKAGIQSVGSTFQKVCEWIPAFAGMTAAFNDRVLQVTLVHTAAC